MRAIISIAALTAASCTPTVAPTGGPLTAMTAGRVAGPPQTCVNANSGANLHAVDAETLVYRDGSTVYVNSLGGRCSGLSEVSTIIMQVQTGQFCRGDHFRAQEPGSIIPGAPCNLGNWVPFRHP